MGIASYFRTNNASAKGQKSNTPLGLASIPAPTSDPRVDTIEQRKVSEAAVEASFNGESTDSTESSSLDDIKHEVMVNFLHHQQCSKSWISSTGTGKDDCVGEGVLLRKSKGQYLACPSQLLQSKLALACAELNVQVALTVSSRIVRTFLAWSPHAVDVPLVNGLRVQILQNVEDLPRARKHQFAAFIASEALLVLWDDDATNIIERATAIEAQLMQLVWEMGDPDDCKAYNEKTTIDASIVDVEDGAANPQARPVHLMNSFLVAGTLITITTLVGLAIKSVVVETMVDHSYIHMVFLLLIPVPIFFSLFFAQVVVGCFAQCIGPVRQMQINSKYYSATCSPRLQTRPLPHITVQCPVYKEGLDSVIAPTVKSIQQAISTYELQGGTANMLIHDDGLQIISEDERQARKDFYADYSIGWTARPKHGSEGFVRRGKFKKASNMNYGLMLSCAVEDKLLTYHRTPTWTHDDETAAYNASLAAVLTEHPRALAAGNIRIGDYILLIDSDTRVPTDCLLDAATEMTLCPSVAIMQFSSGVMQVVHTYFENGITFFTNLIYLAIRYGVANGDVAPFVGHNAILRWSAIQQVSYTDSDGYEKFWSESHVSEDFDMSLRLQCRGYIIRLAAWAGSGFKEGVSLTVYDELARWEKYAYGCNELLFHPIRYWITRGPFTELFKRFVFSDIAITSKITIISYIGTYYAIGAAWIMTLANYFAVGWYNGYLDKYYLDSWKVWFSIVLVFNVLGNISLAVMQYRISDKSFVAALLENFKWVALLFIFWGGLSLHVSQALLAHMFEIDMSWGATAKEAEKSNFFIEVPRVMRKFKVSMVCAVVAIGAMIVLGTGLGGLVPYDWLITDFIAILPMSTVTVSHLLLPIVLNPELMTFSF